MAWYKDPQLYICRETPGLKLYRMKEPIGTPIALSGIIDYGFLDYSKHLCLANNKESDFNVFLSSIKFDGVTFKLINCQGWVVYQMVSNYHHFTWAREPLSSPFYRLPGIHTPEAVLLAEKEALNRKVSKLTEQVSSLAEQVSDLTSKLKECRGVGSGSADEKPWRSGDSSIPNNWVPFEDLDIQNIPRNTFLKIIKAPGALKFEGDYTTNVQASRFYGGISLVAVNIEELIPDKDEARFHPDIWGSYNNAGTSYATRKLHESEM
ncbi:uncharacterized protein LOC113321582 [Papaver somniferum]|uniref:uncharacterized protein LOC113321582 n=1 Tax=Papaver somniferum TaxID=3469 RepID=UPI000E6F9ECA|nr:uncharacterized protein LOC113321582 [Papaver somniferum]XP_026425252.1 uncharacterized protein LOC113321582 [Papaver somniferum]